MHAAPAVKICLHHAIERQCRYFKREKSKMAPNRFENYRELHGVQCRNFGQNLYEICNWNRCKCVITVTTAKSIKRNDTCVNVTKILYFVCSGRGEGV
jgi:hypothetical protein